VNQHLALVGFMAAGKSTVGQRLAAALRRPFVDLDQRVEEATGSSVAEIFESRGEAAFRELESRALRTVLHEGPCVLATGGGSMVDASSRALLREGAWVVWLDLRFDTVRARLASDRRRRRPLAESLGEEGLVRLYRSRRPEYAAVAHLRVEVDRRSPVQLSRWILGALEPMSQPTGSPAP